MIVPFLFIILLPPRSPETAFALPRIRVADCLPPDARRCVGVGLCMSSTTYVRRAGARGWWRACGAHKAVVEREQPDAVLVVSCRALAFV